MIALRRAPLFLNGRVQALAQAEASCRRRIEPVLQEMASHSQTLKRIAERQRALRDELLPEATVALNEAESRAHAPVISELSTLESIEEEMLASLPGDIWPDQNEIERTLAGVEDRGIANMTQVCKSAIAQLQCDQVAIIDKVRDRAWPDQRDRRPADTQSTFEELSLGHGPRLTRDMAGTSGLLAAVVTGGVMGAVNGSVFPGLGNVAGAFVGAGLAFATAFSGTRLVTKAQWEAAIRKHCRDRRPEVAGILELALSRAHEGARALLERVRCEFAEWATATQAVLGGGPQELAQRRVRFEALRAQLQDAWGRVVAFSDGAGLQGWRTTIEGAPANKA